MITTNSVHIDTVMRTPQFWQIWLAFGSVACTGMGVLSIASTMMSEIFSRSMPDVVTGCDVQKRRESSGCIVTKKKRELTE